MNTAVIFELLRCISVEDAALCIIPRGKQKSSWNDHEKVTQDHWKWHHWKAWIWFPIPLP